MTEHNTSFGGLAVADPRSADDMSSDFVAETDNDNKRKLAVVGAIVGVVVLLIAAFFLLKGGGGANSAAPVTPHVVPPAGSTTSHPAAAAHAKKAVALPKTYKAPIGRDPFKALYTPPAPKPAATGNDASNSSTG